MMYGWKEIECPKSAALQGRTVRKPGWRQECPEDARGLPSQDATQTLQKTWSSVNGWMFCGVRGSWRNKGCIVDCGGKIAMAPQRRVGVQNAGVGEWVLRFSKESLFHDMFCDSSTMYSQHSGSVCWIRTPKNSMWWGHNRSSGFCPKCFTGTSSFNSMRLVPIWQVRKLRHEQVN